MAEATAASLDSCITRSAFRSASRDATPHPSSEMRATSSRAAEIRALSAWTAEAALAGGGGGGGEETAAWSAAVSASSALSTPHRPAPKRGIEGGSGMMVAIFLLKGTREGGRGVDKG